MNRYATTTKSKIDTSDDTDTISIDADEIVLKNCLYSNGGISPLSCAARRKIQLKRYGHDMAAYELHMLRELFFVLKSYIRRRKKQKIVTVSKKNHIFTCKILIFFLYSS